MSENTDAETETYEKIYKDFIENKNNHTFRSVINRLLMVKKRQEDARKNSLQIDDQLKQLKVLKKREHHVL